MTGGANRYANGKKPSDAVDLGRDGGFCPATRCKIGHTTIREAFRQAPEAAKAVRSNPKNMFVDVPVYGSYAWDGDRKKSFKMMIRDPETDTFISGHLAEGREHDPEVRQLLLRCLEGKRNAVFVDVGANIGYFTATALVVGARTISFEPFYENAGALMGTIKRNRWEKRATVYMNALGYESHRIKMKSTNDEINKSNMHITGSQCASKTSRPPDKRARYGVDYMESVSLDQVMLQNHKDVRRIHLMKIDVEVSALRIDIYTAQTVIVWRLSKTTYPSLPCRSTDF